MRPLVIEAKIEVDTGKPFYRWHCSKCPCWGHWLGDLNEAEEFGRLHNRTKHAEEVRA